MSNEGNTRFTFPRRTKESEAIMVLLIKNTRLIQRICRLIFCKSLLGRRFEMKIYHGAVRSASTTDTTGKNPA